MTRHSCGRPSDYCSNHPAGCAYLSLLNWIGHWRALASWGPRSRRRTQRIIHHAFSSYYRWDAQP